MIIESLNKKKELLELSGFPETMEYKNDKFKGHQLGVVIGLEYTNGKLESHVKNSEEIFKQILQMKDILIIEEKHNYIDEEGKMSSYVICYLPYFVQNHPAYKPTINFDQVSSSINIKQEVTYEVLLCDDESNRYLYFKNLYVGSMGGRPLNFIDVVEGLESKFEEMLNDKNDDTFEVNKEEGYSYINFYDKAGNISPFEFTRISEVLDMVSSIRIVDIKKEIIKDQEA